MFGSSSPLGFGIHFGLTQNTTGPANEIKNNINSIRNSAKSAGSVIENSLGKITTGFFAVAFAATTLLGPLGLAISKNNEFEKTLSAVQAKSQASAVQMEQLRQQALSLGDATQFSAKEVAAGQEFLAMAGFNVNDMLGAMPGLLDLAAAGQLGLARASDIASNILTQFRLEAHEMNRVSDVLALTASSANTNIEQMADAMKFLGPTAAALKVPLEESSAAIGILANSGLQGSLATRALGTGILRLTKPTRQMTQVMNELGFSAFDSQGNFIGLANMVEQLNKSTKNLTDQQKQGALATLFGAEAIQEINSLMSAEYKIMENGTQVVKKGADALRAFTGELENANGAAQRMAKIQLDNLAGDLTIAQGVFETLMIQIGAALVPVLRPIVQGFTMLLKIMKSIISTPIGKAFVILGAVVAVATVGIVAFNFAASTLIPVLYGVASGVWAVMAPLLPFIAIAAAVVGLIVLLKNGIESTNPKIAAFATVMAVLLGPITGIMAAVMVAKRGIEEFKKVLEGGEVKTGFMGFLQKVGGVLMGVKEIFSSVTDEGFSLSKGVNEALKKLGIQQFVVNLGTWIVRIRAFLMGMKDGFFTAIDPIIDLVMEMWTLIKPVFGAFDELFNSLGFSIGKNTTAIEAFRIAGQIAAKGLLIALTPIKLMLQGIVATINLMKDGANFISDLFSSDDENVNLDPDNENNSRPNKILNQVAENRALEVEKSQPVVLNNTTESVRDLNFTIELDGEPIANRVNDINQLNDDRQ